MKTSNGLSGRRLRRTGADQRAQLLAAFDRSGMSAAAFARQEGLIYSTFCGWRHRRAKTNASSGFVQVQLARAPALAELVIELDARARMRISCAEQIELAARLLQALNATTSC